MDQQKKHGGAPKEEIFITDVAYCEQAAILLKQAKLPQMKNSCKRKEDGTLPVRVSLSLLVHMQCMEHIILDWDPVQ